MYRTPDIRISSQAGSQVTVRMAEESDARALVRLAALDSAETLSGPTLVGEIEGEAVAAVPVRGGRAIADPFRRTTATIELLELRAAQLRGRERPAAQARSYAGRLRTLLRAPRLPSPR